MQRFDKILLVDDDPASNFYNKIMLSEWGVTANIQVFTNGQTALNYIKEEEKNLFALNTLVLLDINMPIMDGFQFLEAYSNLPIAQKDNLLIIMLTSSDHPSDISCAKEFKVLQSFMTKPLNKDTLLACLPEN